MPDHHDLATLFTQARDLHVHLGNQWTSRIENFNPRCSDSCRTACDTPCALKTTVLPRGTSSNASTNIAPLRAQIVDDVFVMHYFVAHVDGRSVQAQRVFDDLDRAIDAGAKAPRFRQYHYHVRSLG